MDFCLYAMNSIVNEAWQYKFLHNGEGINITYIMLIENEWWLLWSKHLQNFQSIFMHFPTLSIYYPSDRNTFYLTINSCLSNNDIDILIINKKIDIWSTFSNYQTNWTLRKLKKWKDLTIITYWKHIQDVLNILDILKEKGIEPDIFDIFSFKWYNLDILIQSINYTKKLLIIDWTRQTCNLSTDIIKNLYLNYTIQNIKIDILNIPETYVPANYYLEKAYFITKEDIFNRIINLCYDN
jgi:pyruvate/2-oxoglutarate/acetoin dehydrogenase E1 component